MLVDICKDAQQAKVEFEWPERIELPGEKDPAPPRAEDLRRAVELIEKAERPLILAGHGVIRSGSSRVLQAYVEKTGTPVASTLLGLGGFPASHPLSLGMMGMHGEAFVNTAIQRADLLLAFGMRFDDRVTGNLKTYAPNAKKIHVEIDASEVGKNVPVDVAADRRPARDAGGAPPPRRRQEARGVGPADRGGAAGHALARHRPPAGRRAACSPPTSSTTSGRPPTATR